MATTKGDLGAIQRGLQTWQNGSCVDMDASVPSWQTVAYLAPAPVHGVLNSSSTTNATHGKLTTRWSPANQAVRGRDTPCTTIQVAAGDSCASLAAECGITGAQFTTYNPSSTLCSSLTPGQHVCCSAGTLPDFSPKPDAEGYCYAYLVRAGDSCSSIATAHSISQDQIAQFNKNTWGWNGCATLFADSYICLSSGYPPMPAPIPNAICGPAVSGTPQAPPGTNLSTLNQCPLNACCDIWGMCGTTAEFCTPSQSSTGAPGTAAPGTNGCISNCGTSLLLSNPPSERYKIAYFEAFDWKRPCLKMSVTSIDTSVYTHIHLAFVTLNPDFSPAGSPSDSDGFFLLLDELHDKIPAGKTISITAPASFWYLQYFPIQALTLVVDYIVYMTYDLHGQWDYKNKWAAPGCVSYDQGLGNCLRSHVNLTETINALPPPHSRTPPRPSISSPPSILLAAASASRPAVTRRYTDLGTNGQV